MEKGATGIGESRRAPGWHEHRAEGVELRARGFSDKDVNEIEEQLPLRTPVIYEIVRRDGEEEMRRPLTSLWWSGVAAGLSISFSLFAQAVLQALLPDAPWRPLITSFGYAVGFVIVVLGRQQLFTENTITVVLPVAAEFTLRKLASLGRMWGIVLAANLVGCFLAALFWTFAPVLTPQMHDAMLQLGQHMMANGWPAMFFRAVAAGFLIAAMVWLLPSAEMAQFVVIGLMTYLIAVGDFTHSIAGSVDVFVLLLSGKLGLWHLVAGFTVPVVLGNVVGGTLLFSVISYAQIMREVS